MATNNLTQSAWADHLLGCADVAMKVAERLGLRDNSAVQACFATVTIDATKHNIFMRPTPLDTKTPVGNSSPGTSPSRPASVAESKNGRETAGETAPAPKPLPGPNDPLPQRQTPPKGEVVGENLGALRDATPEQAENANRTALLEGVQGAVKLLNKEGYVPPMTARSLNKFIEGEIRPGANLGSLDADDLGALLEKLNAKIEAFKTNKKIADDF